MFLSILNFKYANYELNHLNYIKWNSTHTVTQSLKSKRKSPLNFFFYKKDNIKKIRVELSRKQQKIDSTKFRKKLFFRFKVFFSR